jgi:hypothetical protein
MTNENVHAAQNCDVLGEGQAMGTDHRNDAVCAKIKYAKLD